MIFIAAILGVVEGLTEFLPVSSTGHLILAGHWLGFTGEKASTFEIFIQLGAILAVVGLYWERFTGVLSFKKTESFNGRKGMGLLALTTLPALLAGALLHGTLKTYSFNPVCVAFGLIFGSVWIFAVDRKVKISKKESLDDLTWKDALLIGFFQCLAMWPGVSRAGATILGGMMLGVNRKTATEYSFFAAVPVIFAASIYDLLKSLDILQTADIPMFAAGFFVSMLSAWLAVKWFVGYVSRHPLTYFAFYRLALAAAVLLIWK